MSDAKMTYPLDVLIDAGLVLLGTARGAEPAEARALVGALGVLFGGGTAARTRLDPEISGLLPAPQRQARKPGKQRKAAKGGGRRKPRAKPDTPETPPAEKPQTVTPAGAAPKAGEIVEFNGITVSLLAGEEKVTFAELEIEVKPKQARLVACLAAANFLPVAADFIAKRVWAGEKVPEFYEQIIGQLSRETNPAIEQLGLTIKTVRGVGRALQKVEA